MSLGKSRWWEISSIVTKHCTKILLGHKRSGRNWSDQSQQAWLGRQVRVALEELGPTFIKLGQFLSTRPDLVGISVAAELVNLQEQVEQMTWEQVEQQIIRSLGAPPQTLFRFFNRQPTASASIGQVHLAVLMTGERVAVKVQRPGLRDTVSSDLRVLSKVLSHISRPLGLERLCDVEECLTCFRRTIQRELDFRQEGQNIENFRSVLEDFPAVVMPRIYWRYSSVEVLTMEWLDGCKARDWQNSDQCVMGSELAENLMLGLLLPFFRSGMFHGDLHPGNVRVMEDGRLAFLDYGITGYMPTHFRDQAGELIIALWKGNVDKVVELALDMGTSTGKINQFHLHEDMAVIINRVKGLGGENYTFGDVLLGMMQISLNHNLRMPAPFFLLGKALSLAESLARELDPSFQILSVAERLGLELVREKAELCGSNEVIAEKLLDWQQLALELPTQLGEILSQLSRGEMRFIFHHRNLQWLYEMLEVLSSRLALSVIIAAMAVASAIAIHAGVGPRYYGFPILGLVGYAAAFVLGTWMAAFLIRRLN